MQKDLFGNKVIKEVTKYENTITNYDKEHFEERVNRLEYITKLLPDEYFYGSDPATYFIFEEAKISYINGQFISTILLSQAYIERQLQLHYISLGLDKEANRGISEIIKHAKKHNTIHHFLLPKIDELRKIRNPFVHFKEFEHEYNLTQRIFKNIKEGKTYKDFTDIISEDAKEAIRLTCAIFLTPLK